jgi:Na+-driven multidrug efflux pump
MISAALPDPSQPTFILFASAMGAFIGATIGRAKRLARDDLRRMAENWAYLFTAAALLVYVLLLSVELP